MTVIMLGALPCLHLCVGILDYLGMAYKGSDYTIVITIIQRTILLLKLTLVVEIPALLSCCRPPLLEHSLQHSLPVQLLQRAQGIQRDSLTLNMPKITVPVKVVIAVIISVFPLAAIASDQLSVVATWHVAILSNRGCNGYQECACASKQGQSLSVWN